LAMRAPCPAYSFVLVPSSFLILLYLFFFHFFISSFGSFIYVWLKLYSSRSYKFVYVNNVWRVCLSVKIQTNLLPIQKYVKLIIIIIIIIMRSAYIGRGRV
jgi:hypothetical protein